MKRLLYFLTFILLLLAFSVLNTLAQPFEIKQSTIATGGGTSTSGVLSLGSTIGQPIATTDGSMNGLFILRKGFRTPPPFSPTAARASILGRVITNKNIAIKDAIITIIGGNSMEEKVVRTNQFGNFKINNLEVGFFYILTVKHKRHLFDEDMQTFMVFGNIQGVVFRSAKIE